MGRFEDSRFPDHVDVVNVEEEELTVVVLLLETTALCLVHLEGSMRNA